VNDFNFWIAQGYDLTANFNFIATQENYLLSGQGESNVTVAQQITAEANILGAAGFTNLANDAYALAAIANKWETPKYLVQTTSGLTQVPFSAIASGVHLVNVHGAAATWLVNGLSGSVSVTGYTAVGHWSGDPNTSGTFGYYNIYNADVHGSLTGLTYVPTALFTSNADQVNFNQLTPQQTYDINSGANLYMALGGNDQVTLPNAAHYLLTNAVTWNPLVTFNAGAGNDIIIIPTGPSSGTIDGDTGADVVKYTGGTFGVGNLFHYDPAGTASYGDYNIKYLGNTVDSSGTPGVGVLVTNVKAGISDLLLNVENVKLGNSKIPLEAIKIDVDVNGLGTGMLSWSLNGHQMGCEKIFYDPTLPLQTGTYQAIYRTNGGQGKVIELSDCTSGESELPNAEFVQIHGGNFSQNSAGCIVGTKLPGTALGNLFKLLQTTTSAMAETNLNVTNFISTNSKYIEGSSESTLSFGTEPTSPNTLSISNFEQFFQLPIPITVDITNHGVTQPILHLQDDGAGSVTSGGAEKYTLSLNNFFGQELDRDIIVKMKIALSPGASESSIELTDDNGSPIAIHWNQAGTIGKFQVTIENQTGALTLQNPDLHTPTSPPTADFFLDPTTTVAENATLTLLGYQTHIPLHQISTPPGQLMVNPGADTVAVSITPAAAQAFGLSQATVAAADANATDAGTSDVINVGQNDAVHIGGTQDSTLVFTQSTIGSIGAVTITNFSPKHDVIEVNSALATSIASLLAAAHGDGHGNAVITVDAADTITLIGVHASALQAHNFALI
jgi:hypothetical protein